MMRRDDHAQCCIKDYRELETHNLAVVRYTIRVVNFDSDEKSDQKIDIFSANQISSFLQQFKLTPPFRRFSRKKTDQE
jgi:hypothetical protein